MKVTAETITDEQIRELWDASWSTVDLASDCRDALDEYGLASEHKAHAVSIREARARCAEIWNARHGDES